MVASHANRRVGKGRGGNKRPRQLKEGSIINPLCIEPSIRQLRRRTCILVDFKAPLARLPTNLEAT